MSNSLIDLSIVIIESIIGSNSRADLLLNNLANSTLINFEVLYVCDCTSINDRSFPKGLDSHIRRIIISESYDMATIIKLCIKSAAGEYIHFINVGELPSVTFYERLLEGDNKNKDIIKGTIWPVNYDNFLKEPSRFNDLIAGNKLYFCTETGSAVFKVEMLKKIINNVSQTDPIHYAESFALAAANASNGITIENNAILYKVTDPNFHIDKYIAEKSDNLLRTMQFYQHKNNYFTGSGNFCLYLFSQALKDMLIDGSSSNFIYLYFIMWAFKPYLPLNDNPIFDHQVFGSPTVINTIKRNEPANSLNWLAKYFNIEKIKTYILKNITRLYNPVEQCCIVIMDHRSRYSANESASLRQCLKVFKTRKIFLCCPHVLDTTLFETMAFEESSDYGIVRVPDVFFSSYQSCQSLLISPYFYSLFLNYNYILVYQTDAWVFRDEIDEWCAKGYDYIGAPWFMVDQKTGEHVFKPYGGNGGFSLRNVPHTLRALYHFIYKQLNNNKIIPNPFRLDDYTHCVGLPKADPEYKLAPVDEEIGFSFEAFPERLYKINGKLPFGCHAYIKYGKNFWKQFIEIYENQDK